MTQFALGTVVGSDGNGIESIEKTSTSGLVDTYTITFDNGDTETFEVTNGEDGSEVSITQVLSSGTKLATLTIDGTSTDLFCSEGGTADIVTSWESTLSDEKVPSEKLTKNTIDGKADSVHTHTKSQITDFPSLSTVATTGDYDDLLDKPSIPSSSSDLSDASDLIKKSQTAGLVKNDGTIDTTSYVSDISGKQDTLVSGTNIKTINNESVLGSGNITITGGADVGTFTDLQGLITSASSGDILTLDKDYQYDSTTDSSLTSGIVIDKNITINANGHIIDGNDTSRAFTMSGGSNNRYTVTLNNITIQKCKSPTNEDGGAISLSSYVTLQINDSLLTQNNARSGGAICAYSHCNVYIRSSLFTHNTATDGYGGAIINTNYGYTQMDNSLFTNNTSTGRGGVLYGATSTSTTVNNSILTSNTASEGGALSFRNLGSSNKLTMNGTSVYGNTASSSSNIYCNASMTVYNCTLSDNASTYTNVTNYNDVSSENIVDNLTTADATKVLSAKQGKALNDLIGDAITYINGTGS